MPCIVMKEANDLIERFDSFWFFSNVLLSSSTDFQSFEENTAEDEDPQKPIMPILHINQNESTISETELVIKKEETETVIKKEETEIVIKKEEKMMSRRRKIRRRRRKILGEIDLGMINYYEVEQNLKCCASVKMPPLSDGMAMKQHLKSWAFAVACTVR